MATQTNSLRRLPLFLLPAMLLPALTYAPGLNPDHPPGLDLTGPVAVAAYGVAETGGTHGIPLLGVALTAVLVTRPGIGWRRRIIEAVVVAAAVAAFLGGGAFLNEHVVKPAFAVPRPNIRELAASPPDAPALGMTAAEFYALPAKLARSNHLRQVLTPAVRLDVRIREHWIAETGYSFPSGHSFAAMLFATFFLAMGLTYVTGRRLWAFYLLVPWAVAVCVSRPLLRVHSPTDVCVGGAEGVVAGVLAFVLVRWVLAAQVPEVEQG